MVGLSNLPTFKCQQQFGDIEVLRFSRRSNLFDVSDFESRLEYSSADIHHHPFLLLLLVLLHYSSFILHDISTAKAILPLCCLLVTPFNKSPKKLFFLTNSRRRSMGSAIIIEGEP